MSIGDALEEVLYVHRIGLKTERKKKAEELIETVELNRAYLARFPHELSGGQRQRIVLARALAVNPKLLICDEPVSALDVSIQAQIVNLLEELQKNLNITYLFIAHDLSVVKHISKRIAVMYLGKIVETATSDELFQNPRHPYTKALLAAVPSIDPDHKKEKILLEGDMPNIINPPKGCRFNSRCQFAVERCYSEEPIITDLGGGHTVNCHLFT
jgi:oligopeptide/dipeptide ABC transporter ATP-binding protein